MTLEKCDNELSEAVSGSSRSAAVGNFTGIGCKVQTVGIFHEFFGALLKENPD